MKSLNEIAENWSPSDGFNGRMYRWRIKALEETLPEKHEHCLEIGAGEGTITEWLVTKYTDVQIVEPAIKYNRILTDKGFKPHCWTFEEYDDFLEVDAIYAIGVLEHVDDPIAFLKKAKSLLTAGGKLFVMVPNANSLHRKIGQAMGIIPFCGELTEQDKAIGHKRVYDVGNLMADCVEAGFDEWQVTCRGVLVKPFHNEGMMELSDEYLDGCDVMARYYTDISAEILAVATNEE